MQGSPHSVLEGRCPTEFTSNLEGLNPLHQMLHIFRKFVVSDSCDANLKPLECCEQMRAWGHNVCVGVCVCVHLCTTCSKTPSVCIRLQWNYSSSSSGVCVRVCSCRQNGAAVCLFQSHLIPAPCCGCQQ